MAETLADRAADRRPARPAVPTRRDRWRRQTRDLPWALLFIGPSTLGLGVFYLWPAAQTFYFSLTEWGAFGGHTFVGLANYRTLLHDPDVLDALRNTLVFSVLGLLGLPISLALAATLGRPGRKGVSLYRVLMFLPVVTMPAAVAVIWRWLYNGDVGLINAALGRVGIDGPYWISDPHTAMIALVLVSIWSTIGYNMVLLMAGLAAIGRSYYEAAEMDGAGPIRQFRSITLPLLSPTLFFVTVLSVISSLQVFDLIYVMIGKSNPALPQTRTAVYLFYQKAFVDNDRGYAAALALVLVVIIVAVTGLQFWLQKKWVHYD